MSKTLSIRAKTNYLWSTHAPLSQGRNPCWHPVIRNIPSIPRNRTTSPSHPQNSTQKICLYKLVAKSPKHGANFAIRALQLDSKNRQDIISIGTSENEESYDKKVDTIVKTVHCNKSKEKITTNGVKIHSQATYAER